jgi:RNA polymerase sigma-70 factor (ECF subfamily)
MVHSERVNQRSISDADSEKAMTLAEASSPATMQGAFVASPPRVFEQFYRRHRDTIGRALALTLNDEMLGFEATDEAMARAYERWNTVSGYANPEGWVYRTGLNWARSFLRRRKRSRPKDLLLVGPDVSSDRLADTDLARALATLSDDHRAVVVLRFYSDWTVEQTARALDVAPGTIKSRLSRALDLLSKEL